jgi:hypothetical protein
MALSEILMKQEWLRPLGLGEGVRGTHQIIMSEIMPSEIVMSAIVMSAIVLSHIVMKQGKRV